ncbi:class I SAM-dependent methyltransferase [Candidatus Woesearchaeota archaeon]|nr:class I SAM-dependent methyltransferase [Candidatus Woesearchaeota archaeon]
MKNFKLKKMDGFNDATLKRLRFFKKYAKGTNNLLELTVQNTHFPMYYDNVKEITVLDIDKKYLRKAKNDYAKKVVQHDLEKPLPFKNNTFDRVMAGEIIEHLKETDQLIKECKRVLKSNGLLVGSTPNASNIRQRIQYLFGKVPDVEHPHIRFYNKKALKKQLTKHFDKVSIKYLGVLRGKLLFKCEKI